MTKIRFKNVLVLMLVCIVMGAAVSLSNAVAAPRIAERANAVANSSRAALFPEADAFEEQTLPADSALDSCHAALRSGELLGYTAQATVSGSQGMIEVTVGMDTAQRLTGISVGGANFAETPGMGAKTRDPEFTDQFIGLALPAALKDNVDGVSGATISSTAVVNAVNRCGYYMASLLDPNAAEAPPEIDATASATAHDAETGATQEAHS